MANAFQSHAHAEASYAKAENAQESQTPTTEAPATATTTTTTKKAKGRRALPLERWHKRLGHLNYADVKQLATYKNRWASLVPRPDMGPQWNAY
jgi:hypothetical protein